MHGQAHTFNAARISLAVGVLVFLLKWWAYWLTDSVALYSDALESVVNIIGAAVATWAVWVARRPASRAYPYGYAKAEYFSAVLEGTLIIIAAFAIIHAAWERLYSPVALQSGLGLVVSLVATLVNAALAGYLLQIAKKHHSPALRADGLHIFSDVITSLGVLFGIGLAWWSGLWILDPLLAIVVALNILWMGGHLLRSSIGSLMDEGLSHQELLSLQTTLTQAMAGALQIHNLKTRRAGATTFVEFHLVVSAEMRVKEAHEICDRLEHALQALSQGTEVTIHVEPEDEVLPRAFVLHETHSELNQ
jgi:cation diffusion facilitator family transporter